MINIKLLTLFGIILSAVTFSGVYAYINENEEEVEPDTYSVDVDEGNAQSIYPAGCIPTIELPLNPTYIPCIAFFPPELDYTYYIDDTYVEPQYDEEVQASTSQSTTTYYPQSTTSSINYNTSYYSYPYQDPYYYAYTPGAFAIGFVYGAIWNAARYNYNYWHGYSWNSYKAGTWNTQYGHGGYWYGPNYTGYCRNGVCNHWETGQRPITVDKYYKTSTKDLQKGTYKGVQPTKELRSYQNQNIQREDGFRKQREATPYKQKEAKPKATKQREAMPYKQREVMPHKQREANPATRQGREMQRGRNR